MDGAEKILEYFTLGRVNAIDELFDELLLLVAACCSVLLLDVTCCCMVFLAVVSCMVIMVAL